MKNQNNLSREGQGSVVIVGLGSIGRRHLQNLRNLGITNFTAVRTYRGTLNDNDMPGVVIETDLTKALSARPDAVVIANPTSKHLAVALPAIEAGCHLLMEKPISDSMQGIEELEKVVKKSGRQVVMGFQFRFHPGLQQIKELLDQKVIGNVLSVQAHWGEYLPDWHPWEDYRISYATRNDLGGGVILTLCHPIDYLRWLIGDMTEVWASTGNRQMLGIGVEETADISLKSVDGVLLHVHVNYVQRPGRHTLQIIGERGTIQWDNATGHVSCFRVDEGKETIHSLPEGFERNNMFIEETKHFWDCVTGEATSRCTLNDGKKTLEIVLAAKQSIVEKRSIPLHHE